MTEFLQAAVCACGRRIESSNPMLSAMTLMAELKAHGHDPNECSRGIAYQGRFDGRREMALAAVEHLIERRTLSGEEIAEIRTNLLDLVHSLPLGAVSA